VNLVGGWKLPERAFPALDGLRAVAALAVLVHHSGFDTGDTFSGWFGNIWAHGDVGVPIFFALSGFLLYRGFANAHRLGRPTPSASRFWWKRVLRIVPAYWVAFAGCVVLFGVETGGASKLARYLTFTQIYRADSALGGLPQAWSLCVEVSFYAALPLYAMAINRLAQRTDWARAETIGVATLVAISLLYRVVLGVADPSWKGTALFWLPAHLDSFAVGIGCAVATVGGIRWQWARSIICLPIAAATYLFVAYGLDLPKGLVELGDSQSLVRQGLYALIALLLLAPLTVGHQTPSMWTWTPLAWLGVWSYGIYLWHKSLITWLAGQINDREFGGNMASITALAVAGSAALAAVTWRYVEQVVTSSGETGRLSSIGPSRSNRRGPK
jgi:peptidoglycan/LPS O-acetylase OafA/YrhL